eukprot:1181967-Prorocentrum_minimum.AAC.4
MALTVQQAGAEWCDVKDLFLTAKSSLVRMSGFTSASYPHSLAPPILPNLSQTRYLPLISNHMLGGCELQRHAFADTGESMMTCEYAKSCCFLGGATSVINREMSCR